MAEKIKKLEAKMGGYIFAGIILFAVAIVLLCTIGPFGTVLGYVAFAVGALGLLSFWRGYCKYLDKKELQKANAESAPAESAAPATAPAASAESAAPPTAPTDPVAPEPPAHTDEAVMATAKAAREAKAKACETVRAYKAYQEELRKALDEFA